MTTNRRTLHAIGNAHIDPVWLWRRWEGIETVRSTFRSALDRMHEYPAFVFTSSSSAFFAMIEDIEPDMLAEIQARVEEGRWELVGGWWIEPDANVPCGESLARQGLYGQQYLQRVFGRTATIGYNPDTFGHPATLPQILGACGLTRYVFMRPGPHEMGLPSNVFIWRAADGTETLTLRIARSYATWPEQVRDHVMATERDAPIDLEDYAVFYGVGNHGGGPTKRNIESLLEMAGEDLPFDVRLSTLESCFTRIEAARRGGVALPVVGSELQHHARGCYTAHSAIKAGNRRVEHALMSAERMAVSAHILCDRQYPTGQLASAWKSLLFTQFHDILAGTSLPLAYEDARDMHGYAATIADDLLAGSLQSITSRIDTRGVGNAVVLFNPLPWPTQAIVEIERGAPKLVDAEGIAIPCQAIQPTTVAGQRRSCAVVQLPAMGYRLVREAEGRRTTPSAGRLDASGMALENDWWRIEIDERTGLIGSLIDSRTGAQVLAYPSSLEVIDDPSDTWSHDVKRFDASLGAFACTQTTLEEHGAVRASIRSELSWGSSRITHWTTIYRDLPTIECRLSVFWSEQRKGLKLAIPSRLEGADAVYEAPYGHVVRAQDGDEHPGQQWALLQGRLETASGDHVPYALALLNDSKYGFDAANGCLRMSILRSPAFAHHDPATLDATHAYRFIDQGEQNVRYRLIPIHGDWRDAAVARQALELNVPPIWVNEHSHTGNLPTMLSAMSAEPDNIVMLVCKLAEDGGALVVRGYEAAGRPVRARMRLPILMTEWEAEFGAHQIRSWLVRLDGSGEPQPCTMLELASDAGA